MKKVFIIGNGFDLNLGLPTSYSDFIKSNYFQRNCGNGYQLFDHLKNVYTLNCWVDVELELVEYAKKKPNIDKFRKDYEKLCSELCDYIKNMPMNYKRETCAYKLISEFYTDDDAIISFNYTNACEKILEDNNRKKNITYIHGLAKDNNIIFGVHDKSGINSKFSFLLKSGHQNFQIDVFVNIASEVDCFIFFGHSLGQTDYIYLKNYLFSQFSHINPKKDKSFVFSYNQGRDDLNTSLVEITDDNLATFKANIKYRDFYADKIDEMTKVLREVIN